MGGNQGWGGTPPDRSSLHPDNGSETRNRDGNLTNINVVTLRIVYSLHCNESAQNGYCVGRVFW